MAESNHSRTRQENVRQENKIFPFLPLIFLSDIFLSAYFRTQEDKMVCNRTPGLIALLFCSFLLISEPAFSQKTNSLPPKLPTMREQAEIQQQWLKLRLERILPDLMRKHNVSMWLVICREYNEDPAYRSLTSPTVFAARRRTILVFYDQGREKGLERLALGGGSNGGLYRVYRDPEVENRELWGEGQWALLRKMIAERDPKTIAIDISPTHAFSDGLSAGEWEKLQQTLGQEYLKRVVRAEL